MYTYTLKNQKGKKGRKNQQKGNEEPERKNQTGKRNEKTPGPHLRTRRRRGLLRARHVPRRAGGRVRGQSIHIARNRLDGLHKTLGSL